MTNVNVTVKPKWWKEAVFYQIYPRSFKDSNGDGIGDIRGIVEKLDYLQDLGVNVVWICPVFKSPQDDNGYDISDYQDIHHEFGTMEDVDHLLKEMHRRGMKLIMDLVINHTSDEHPWFLESRSSKDNAKRDWYIWRDGKNGHEPNNWESIFEGSAWKYDSLTQQYFLHLFSARQPDLNWENQDMKNEIYKMIRWWLDRGIDGFRIDAISHTKKVPGLPDLPNPHGERYVDSKPFHMNVDGVLHYLAELCEQTFSRYDVVTVGEANGVDADQAEEWVSEEKKRLSMIIQFGHQKLWDAVGGDKFDLAELKHIFTKWQKNLHGKGWNALFVENHDIPRVTSKWGDTGEYWRESATCIAALYFLMEGSPFIYQGQEIGMTNTVFNGPDDFQDVYAKNHFATRRAEGATDEEITREIASTSRDNSRTPMQWNAQPNGGFTTGKPWLKVNPNYKEINVEAQLDQPGSILSFYKKMVFIRKENHVLLYGAYDLILADHPEIYAYTRSVDNDKAWIICNMRGRPAEANMPESDPNALLIMSNYETSEMHLPGQMKLRPFECRVYLRKQKR